MRQLIQYALPGVIVGAFVFLSPAAGQAQSTNPLVGTWVLNVDKSAFQPANFAPDAKDMTLELVGDRLRMHTRTIRGQGAGSARETELTVGFDGSEVEVPATGVKVSLKKMSDTSFERMAKGDGPQMETSTWTLSADRKMLTVTTEGVDAFGAKYTSTQVFERGTAD
ncbi:MAG: hypothetical protein HY657_09830 [Acidobacteria bacterium]|nr:hypothetical protein [Acidobacteriota bacterium]